MSRITENFSGDSGHTKQGYGRKALCLVALGTACAASIEAPATADPPAAPASAGATVQTGSPLWHEFEAGRVVNPVMSGADPHALGLSGRLWMYPTWDSGGGTRFFAFSSTNLVDWQRHGPILDFAAINWINDDGQQVHHAWAPCLVQKDERFYFYYSVGPQNPTPSRIGVAMASSPAGPFVDSGKPLLTGGDGFEAIDPMVFRDPRSGRFYFYAGGSAGAKLRAFELASSMTSFAREIPVKTPPRFTEGVFMHFHQGTYYLSYSHGGWRDASYSVHYATATSPEGPWHYRGRILSSDKLRKGPGHHSVVQDETTGHHYIFYHRWEGQTGDGPYRGSRKVAIDRLSYDSEGLINPVRMTGGETSRAIAPASRTP